MEMKNLSEELEVHYIGEITVQDAEEKGFYRCEAENDPNKLHLFEQWLYECGDMILHCVKCEKNFQID